MAKKKQKKKKSAFRKNLNKKMKKFEQIRRLFFEKLGVVVFFSIIVAALFPLIVWQWQNFQVDNQESDIASVDYQTRVKFVETISPIAQRLQRQYGIFASVSMAQAMLESEFGQSKLASEYNNLFGVKTDASDPDGADLKTLEFEDGEWVEIVDRFKVYESWAASMEAHAQLLVNGTSWDANYYKAVTDATTPEGQARGLQEAGYATDPEYANKLIEMMNEWNLNQYNQPTE